MRKVYGSAAFGLQTINNGFIFLKRSELEEKLAVSYKKISFDDNSMSTVTKDVYKAAKFGNDYYMHISDKSTDYILGKAAQLDDKRLFFINPNGNAKIINDLGDVLWSGMVKYKDNPPSDILVIGSDMWASFRESNSIIRFNTRTMREELRIGGTNESTFSHPAGMWYSEITNSILVCNEKSHNIVEINLGSYSVVEYENFSEPVHQYIKVGPFEIVWLDSGIYRL